MSPSTSAMQADDSSTILESSLFYSCLSATDFDEQDGKCGSASDEINNNESETRIEGSTPPSRNLKVQPRDANPAPLHRENCDERKISNEDNNNNATTVDEPPSANSSWSVLSESERPIVRSINFNRDRTCLVLSTSAGVRIRTLESLHHSSLQKSNDNGNGNGDDNNDNRNTWMHDVPLPPDGATYAQLLHDTSLLAVVTPSSPRCCFLYDARNASSPLAALPLSAAVKRVELQRGALAAMTVDLRLHVFHMTEGDARRDIDSGAIGDDRGGGKGRRKLRLHPTLITTLNVYHPSDSPRNVTRGMDGFNAGSYFDLSASEDAPYLACKSFNGTPGTVRVYDPTVVHGAAGISSGGASVGSKSARSTTSSLGSKRIKRRIQLLTTIDAHNHSVTRMLIGGGGGKERRTFLATASSKGTNIKVFGLPKGDQLWAWHRGSKSCRLHSLSWNGTADRLAAHGSSGTIHVFDWQKRKDPAESTEDVGGGDDDDDESRNFERVYESFGREQSRYRKFTSHTAGPRPLLRRIGSSVRRISSDDGRNRSMAKLRYAPSVRVGNGEPAPRTRQALVLSLLDREHGESGRNDPGGKEDDLVLCSVDGELRRYSVMGDGGIGLIQIEDVLAR